MARYDRGWNEGRGGWRGGQGLRGRQGPGGPGSRRRHDWSDEQGYGYCVDYKGRGEPFGTGYEPGTQGDFGGTGYDVRGVRQDYGVGYDLGYQGGEFGYSTGGRTFGGRGRSGRGGYGNQFGFGRNSYARNRYMGAGYAGEYGYPGGVGWQGGGVYGRREGGTTGRGGPTRNAGWRGATGRGPSARGEGGYGGTYSSDVARGRGQRLGGGGTMRGYGREFGRGGQQGEPRYEPGRWHEGHTPVDRWPGDEHEATPRRDMSDDAIHNSVRENLFQDSYIDPNKVEVSVDDGVVTLTGQVGDFMQARYAWDDAWDSPGVKGVINNLTVMAGEPKEEFNLPQTTDKFGREGGTRSGGKS